MSGKRKTDKDEGTTAVLNGTEHTNGDQPYPQKIVKEFACPCGKATKWSFALWKPSIRPKRATSKF
jgi:hypothetical protein